MCSDLTTWWVKSEHKYSFMNYFDLEYLENVFCKTMYDLVPDSAMN